MDTDKTDNPIKEVLDGLFTLLESMETQNAAVLELLKDQGLATDERLGIARRLPAASNGAPLAPGWPTCWRPRQRKPPTRRKRQTQRNLRERQSNKKILNQRMPAQVTPNQRSRRRKSRTQKVPKESPTKRKSSIQSPNQIRLNQKTPHQKKPSKGREREEWRARL